MKVTKPCTYPQLLSIKGGIIFFFSALLLFSTDNYSVKANVTNIASTTQSSSTNTTDSAITPPTESSMNNLSNTVPTQNPKKNDPKTIATADSSYVYNSIAQYAYISYVDDDLGLELNNILLSGVGGTTSSYRTTNEIQKWENAGYTFVSQDYPNGGLVFDTNSGVNQFSTVHFKLDKKLAQQNQHERPETPSDQTDQSTFPPTSLATDITSQPRPAHTHTTWGTSYNKNALLSANPISTLQVTPTVQANTSAHSAPLASPSSSILITRRGDISSALPTPAQAIKNHKKSYVNHKKAQAKHRRKIKNHKKNQTGLSVFNQIITESPSIKESGICASEFGKILWFSCGTILYGKQYKE
ncbi:mucin-binding protein [Furfurilactobacillus sp. WILCCON 0119]